MVFEALKFTYYNRKLLRNEREEEKIAGDQ